VSNNSELLHVIKGKLISFQSFGQDLICSDSYKFGIPSKRAQPTRIYILQARIHQAAIKR